MSAVAAVTQGQGRTRPRGRRVALDPLLSPTRALAAALEGMPAEVEGYWSPCSYTGDHRSNANFICCIAAVVDVDWATPADDPGGTPTPEALSLLRDLVANGDMPGSVFHFTPHGCRIAFAFAEPCTEGDLVSASVRGAGARVADALASAGLLGAAGYVIDPLDDLARFFFSPRAFAKGRQRNDAVVVLRDETFAPAELAASAAANVVQPASAPATPAPRATRFAQAVPDAIANYNADRGRTFPAPGSGTCPICGHSGCFGQFEKHEDRWACFSTDHPDGVGNRGKGCYHGDTFDLDRHATGKTTVQFLRDSGYLAPPTLVSSPTTPINYLSPQTWIRFRLNDTGNAERLVTLHGDDLRHVGALKGWLVWNGQRWERDDTNEVIRRAGAVRQMLDEEIRNCPDEEVRKAIRTWANKTEMAEKLRAMVNVASSREQVIARTADFDRDRDLLNVANGTIDLRTGELRPHRREDLMTKIVPVAYDPAAMCPRWDSFLAEIIPSAELRAFVQRAVGYSLTGDTSEQVIFVAHGGGANGKSVLIETVKAILGDYAQAAAKETFTSSRDGDKIPNDLASMVGARMVSVVETDEGRFLDEAFIKTITGGDEVRARFMRAEWFTYRPTFKPWLITNHKPKIRGNDHAIWRRIRLIPFAVTIPAEQQEKHLTRRLLSELPGILRWAVEGCIAWRRDGLGMAAEVEAATKNYRSEQGDHMGAFLAERCAVIASAWTSKAALREAYLAWAGETAANPLGPQTYNARLRDRFEEEQLTTGAREKGWRGVGLRG